MAGPGTTIRNRLTHSLKVTAVARAIAVSLRGGTDDERSAIAALGGCDPVVARAAASAHDLGHPPFGHLGEQVLDGSPGNASGLPGGSRATPRPSAFSPPSTPPTRPSASSTSPPPFVRRCSRTCGRAASGRPPTSLQPPELPRGVGPDGATGAQKFSAYSMDAAEMANAKAAYPAIAPHQQTVECSVKDIADDIVYSVHDLDDFYPAGVLQYTPVSAELTSWLANQRILAEIPRMTVEASVRTLAHSLELAWRAVCRKDAWIAGEDAFREPVLRVNVGLAEALLATPPDGESRRIAR